MTIHRILVPPIKCQEIKTKLVPWIKAIIPSDFDGRWIEPFLGSGVVVFNVRPRKALLADSNPHLINFYQSIANGGINTVITRRFLEKEEAELLRSKGEYYYVVRERFNRYGNSLDFPFLNHACFNGMIRFNQRGKFNVPFCRKPNRFAQAYITKISNQVQAVADACVLGDYEFRCQDYSVTIAETSACDLLYCDPPYITRHINYFNSWDERHEKQLAKLLANTQTRFILSTWHGNEFRTNQFIDILWARYSILTKGHFYHVGTKKDNRNPMLEALVMNFSASYEEEKPTRAVQLTLLEKRSVYNG